MCRAWETGPGNIKDIMIIQIKGNHPKTRAACGHRVYVNEDYYIVNLKSTCSKCINSKIDSVINVPQDLVNGLINL